MWFSKSHPFFSSTKMLGICPLSVEPMNFCFTHAENVGYLSPKIHNTFIYNDLVRQKNVGYLSQKCWVFVPDTRKMLGICPQMLGICPQMLGICPRQLPKKPFFGKMLGICPRHSKNVGYLSPKCWVFVPKMLGICPRTVKLSI